MFKLSNNLHFFLFDCFALNRIVLNTVSFCGSSCLW